MRSSRPIMQASASNLGEIRRTTGVAAQGVDEAQEGGEPRLVDDHKPAAGPQHAVHLPNDGLQVRREGRAGGGGPLDTQITSRLASVQIHPPAIADDVEARASPEYWSKRLSDRSTPSNRRKPNVAPGLQSPRRARRKYDDHLEVARPRLRAEPPKPPEEFPAPPAPESRNGRGPPPIPGRSTVVGFNLQRWIWVGIQSGPGPPLGFCSFREDFRQSTSSNCSSFLSL